jgi:hypothetical protein
MRLRKMENGIFRGVENGIALIEFSGTRIVDGKAVPSTIITCQEIAGKIHSVNWGFGYDPEKGWPYDAYPEVGQKVAYEGETPDMAGHMVAYIGPCEETASLAPLEAFDAGNAGNAGIYGDYEVVVSEGRRILRRGSIIEIDVPAGRRVKILGSDILGSVQYVGRMGWAIKSFPVDDRYVSVIPDGQGWDPRAFAWHKADVA